MKRSLYFFLLLSTTILYGQEDRHFDVLEANYYYGNILLHNKDIAHLRRGHPSGLVVAFNRKTFGDKRWQRTYNYPDWGISMVYQDGGYDVLGENYGIYAHANFYFIKRRLMFRIGQGIAYASNPFDLETNFKNNAYGSRLLSSTYAMLNYRHERLIGRFGLQAGIHFLHYSNGNFKAPNSSTNALTFNLGVNYHLNPGDLPEYQQVEEATVKEKLRFNFTLRFGLNESDYLNLGQHPFAVISAYADKRLGYTSSIVGGVEAFFARFLDKEIEYLVASGLNPELSGDEDYRRVGIFAGHELHFDQLALITHLGYYLYYPYDFEGRIYLRAGLKYDLGEHLFAVISMKSHGAKVEGIEFGMGWRI